MNSSTSPVTAPSVKEVLAQAVSSNQISAKTAQVMEEELDDIALAGCTGIPVADLDTDENTLVTVVIDASSSMGPFQDAVIRSYNDQFLKPMKKAQNAESILVSAWIFSGSGKDACRLLHGYTPVSQCPELDDQTYDPYGSTPLWEAVQKAMTGIVTYGQTLVQAGSRIKHIIVVLSDGENNSSKRGITAAKIQAQAADLLKQETFVLAYAFFGAESDGDYYAKEIGFPENHRITAGLNDSEIRRIFREVSASVISTSQAQVSTNLSGNAFFANP